MRQRDTSRNFNLFLPRTRQRRESINASSFLTSNLLWWIRPGTSGSGTSWPDSTGNGNNAAVSNTSWAYDVPGSISALNGSSQHVSVNDVALLRITGNLTISALCMFNVLPVGGQYPSLIQKSTDFTGYGLDFSGDTQLIEFLIGNGVNNWVKCTTSAPPVLRWTVYTATYDGLIMILYKDGIQVSSIVSSQNPPTNTAQVIMGRHYSNGAFGWLNGKIGARAIWNRALSATEVYSHSRLWLT
jgi:hypothetical protein